MNTNYTKPQRKSHMKWSWIIIISFFLLGIIDFKFGIFGFICMTAPIYHAIKGEGKVHCSKYCPRGSFLGKFLKHVSMDIPLPSYMRTKKAKNIILALMLTVFSFSMIHTGFEFNKMAFALFRFMGMSFAVGIIMGIFFKPRSWCQICPMGHMAGLTANQSKKLALFSAK